MGVTVIKFKVISKDEFQLDLNHLDLSNKALLSHLRFNEMLLFLLSRAVSLLLHSQGCLLPLLPGASFSSYTTYFVSSLVRAPSLF